MARPWVRPLGATSYLCAKCGITKDAGEFRTMQGYIGAYCKSCSLARTQQWRAEHPDEISGRRKARYRSRSAEEIERDRARTRRSFLKRFPPKPVRTGRCDRCLIEFTTNQPQKKYCGDLCRVNARHAWHRPIKMHQKLRIFERDGWRCYICGRDTDRTAIWPAALSATVDHFIPRVAGGSDADSNLRTAHWGCNEDKGERLPSEIWTAA